MNTPSNVFETGVEVVNISTGAVFTASCVEHVPARESKCGVKYPASQRFYYSSEVRQDGTPDRRSRGHVLGVSPYDKGLRGQHARFDHIREQRAAARRATIDDLRERLAAAEQDLLSLYV